MAFVAKGYFFTEGRGRMYLSELFLRTLEREHSSTAVQTALITCNRELCRRMGGIFDEGDCIRYFFYTDQNDEIRKPNENYQELIDFGTYIGDMIVKFAMRLKIKCGFSR